MKRCSPIHPLAAFLLSGFAGLLLLCLCVLPAWSEQEDSPDLQPPDNPQQKQPPKISLSAAVRWALEHNPALGTFRRNHGIAAAAVQVARQYPFNPIFQHFVWYANGPADAGVTNHVFNEHTGRLDLELNGQGRYRRGMAMSALSRTEWEIAAQELLTAVQVARAFNTLLYRKAKYEILEEGLNLTEGTAEWIKPLVEHGQLRTFELSLANADVVEARNLMGPARSLWVVAENDLRRALGLVNERFQLDGTLEKGFAPPPYDVLNQAALERRPDLHALEFAVKEADNRLRLEVANRWGNPSFGPAFEYNETSVFFTGTWLIWSPPVINTRRGEIRQREAEKARAMQALYQGETLVRQDVFAALNRLEQAENVTTSFRAELLPKLRKTRDELDALFTAGQGVDLARVIDIRRRLLRARDAYLDALFELSQAQVDLAAAVADVSFAGCQGEITANEDQGSDKQTPTAPLGEELQPPKVLPEKQKLPAAPPGEKLPEPKQVPGK